MRKSAGIVLYRQSRKYLEVFLVHPGGPFWKGKEEGAWSIPKGEFTDDEDPLTTARREFHEETSFEVDGEFKELGQVQQKGGSARIKRVDFRISTNLFLFKRVRRVQMYPSYHQLAGKLV